MLGFKEKVSESGAKAEHFTVAGCEVDLLDNVVVPKDDRADEVKKLVEEIANAKKMKVYSSQGELLTGRQYNDWKKKYYEENNKLIEAGKEHLVNQELVEAIGENYFTRMPRLGYMLKMVLTDHPSAAAWKEAYSKLQEKANDMAHESISADGQASFVAKLDGLADQVSERHGEWDKDRDDFIRTQEILAEVKKAADYPAKYRLLKKLISVAAASPEKALSLEESVNDWSAVLDEIANSSYSMLPVERKEILGPEVDKLLKDIYEKL